MVKLSVAVPIMSCSGSSGLNGFQQLFHIYYIHNDNFVFTIFKYLQVHEIKCVL